MAKIRELPEHIIKQVAAGEVIENPASIVKELVENSIDAGSTSIEVRIRDGGKSFISVSDDGCGMSEEDLRLSVVKHATSKLPDLDLFNISSMGFRGEALFAITFCSKVLIKSKQKNSSSSYQLAVAGGKDPTLEPSNLTLVGTYVEVRDLFFNIPARLKFLRNNTTESRAVYKVVEQLSIAKPTVQFKVYNDGKLIIDYPSCYLNATGQEEVLMGQLMAQAKTDLSEDLTARLIGINKRMSQVVGKSFQKNSLAFYESSSKFIVYGYVGYPTYNANNTSKQFLFVNGRFIRDKNFSTILKISYAKVLEKSKFPVACVFIDIAPSLVDVNVSPAKTEVRFSDFEYIKTFLIACIRRTIEDVKNQETSPKFGEKFVQLVRPSPQVFEGSQYIQERAYQEQMGFNRSITKEKTFFREDRSQPESLRVTNTVPIFKNSLNEGSDAVKVPYEHTCIREPEGNLFTAHKLGCAKAQFNQNWVIAESKDGLVIVDQHAAHERIVAQRLYQTFLENKTPQTTSLLVPEIIEGIPLKDMEVVTKNIPTLRRLGLVIDIFGTDAIIVREYPAILEGNLNFKTLLHDLVSDLVECNEPESLLAKFRHVIATIACHNSVRSGRKLSLSEMNSLLRDIENTENSAECPHGRPTFVKITWSDLEKLFNRS